MVKLHVNGYDVIISAEYISNGGVNSWSCSTYAGGPYNSLQELNADLPRLIEDLPSIHWEIRFEFQDKEA